ACVITLPQSLGVPARGPPTHPAGAIVTFFVIPGVGEVTDTVFWRANLHPATANAVASETPSHSRHRRRITVRKFEAESAWRPGRNWLQTVLKTEQNRAAWRRLLNRCRPRSRWRTGCCEFSTRLFWRQWRRWATLGNTAAFSAA